MANFPVLKLGDVKHVILELYFVRQLYRLCCEELYKIKCFKVMNKISDCDQVLILISLLYFYYLPKFINLFVLSVMLDEKAQRKEKYFT